ncbi:hypothetical protein [Paucisalibacillus sp. EB02]|uniref:hypothetical protein n=1 Tax=Paucisalibacillus sp. EB02 TaxID=1347087 RepID=UPI0004B4E398|nr:hypothetical protein [Paucisalibacillus sp. EB02]
MKKVESPFQEAKQLLHPIKERPNLDPSPEFLDNLHKQIVQKNIKKRPTFRPYPLLAIASLILIVTVVILSTQTQEQLATEKEGTFTIAETSQIELIDTFVYGESEGKVGLKFLGERHTLPVNVASFDVQNGVIYILDEARNQILIRKGDTTTSFPIQTYLVDLEDSLEDILVTDNGDIYVLSTIESLVYQYDVDGVLVASFDYSDLDMFHADSLHEFANGDIVLSQNQEEFVNLDTMSLIADEELPYRFETVNRTENKLFINNEKKDLELTISADLGIGSRSVLAINKEQIIVTKTVTAPVFAPISETHVLAFNKEGAIIGGVRIPNETFMEKPVSPEKYIDIDDDKVYVLVPETNLVVLYELTLGKQYESFIKQQADLVKMGFDYQTFGDPFPELEKEINDLLTNKKLQYGNEDSLNGVAINEEGTVVIDFEDFLAPSPASAESQQLFQTLNSVTFEKFPEIQEIYFQFDGSFSAWCYWLGSTEEPMKRVDSARDSLANNTIEISEYGSIDEWMQDMKRLIEAEIPPNMTKESYEMHIGASSVTYANYYLDRTTEEKIREKLYAIKEKGLDIDSEMDAVKREELLHELYNLID